MSWIYLIESIPKITEIKTSPLLFQIFMATVPITVATHTVPYLRKKKGVQCPATYIVTVATGIVTLAQPSLLMHSSDECADVTIPIATNNACHY
jgi:hypothetical protein